MADRRVGIDIVGDASKFTKATSSATKSAETMSGKLSGIGKGLVIGAGAAAFGLVENAIGGVISKLGDADQAFKDDQASQESLAHTAANVIPGFTGITDATNAAVKAGQELGFSADDQRNSLAQLIGITHDQTSAVSDMQLAQDLARSKGIDLASATDIVTKAAQGNTKALKSLGIDLTGVKTGAQALDAIQKNVAGSAAAWADTAAGKTAVSQEKVTAAMVKVGAIVDQVTQAVLPIAADAFSNVADAISVVWTAIQPTVATIATNLIPVFKKVGDIAGVVFPAVIKIVQALSPVFATVFGVIATVVGGVVDAISQNFDAIVGAVRGAMNLIVGIVNGVIGAIDAVQVHIHIDPPIGPSIDFDWNGVGLGKLPYFHSGGLVPGTPGSDQLAVLQAGERVLPRTQSGGGDVHIHIDQGAYMDPSGVDRLASLIATRMRTAPNVRGFVV